MKFHTRFNPAPSPSVNTGSESIVQQQWEPETKIDYLLRKYSSQGFNPYAPSMPADFLDVSELGDFQDQQNKLLDAQDYFDSLPSHIRLQFQNNPSELISFLLNPKNKEKAIELGLFPKPVENDTPLEQKEVSEVAETPAPSDVSPSD